MLSADGVSFRYSPRQSWILREATISVGPGEIVGLKGPSGQGKTTLGKILAGYLKPASGKVTVDGRPLPGKGYCPVQIIFQHPELAVNPRWRIRRILSEGHEPSPELARDLSIDGSWMKRWPNELSGGELQRICVSRALGPGTRYIVADETTAMLDAITQAQIWHAIGVHARTRGVGVLAISHEVALLGRVCDRIVDCSEINGESKAGQLSPEEPAGLLVCP